MVPVSHLVVYTVLLNERNNCPSASSMMPRDFFLGLSKPISKTILILFIV